MKKATVEFYGGLYYVLVETRMPEGYFQVISHAPYSPQPKFNTKEQALAFIAGFGEMDGIIFTGYSM